MSPIARLAPLLAGLALTACLACAAPPDATTLDLGGGAKMALARIPAGEFMMGSPDREKERQDCETPVHKVRITRPFHMGKYEVTNAQYRAFRPGHHSRYLDGDNQPALWVSWHDAEAFCRWLSGKAGRRVRLPTEAQWEYACRAGTTTRFHTGDRARQKDSADLAKAGWSGGTARGRSREVGQRAANAFGLHDMHGNAWEWCRDWYAADYYKRCPAADPPGPEGGRAKVLRGGSYRFWTTYYCRSAHRYSYRPDGRECVTGFRVVVEAGKPDPAPAAKTAQPWPQPRQIVPPYAPASDAERQAAKAFGPPAVLVPKAAAPKIDGRLDDAVWRKARPLRFRHTNGRAAPPTAATVARALRDEGTLYFAFDCAEPDMARLRVAGRRRDENVFGGDAVGVLLDPACARTVEACYNLAVNPAGVTRDTRGRDGAWTPRRFGIGVGGRRAKWDRPAAPVRWDPKLRVAARRGPAGWAVEIALPLAELGVQPGQVPTVMGMNLYRVRPEITSRRLGKPRLGTLVPHAWPTDDPDVYRPGEETGWAAALSPYPQLPIRFGHAVLEGGSKKTPPPARLFELIGREDFADGTRGRFTQGTVEPGGYMGVGKALRFPQKLGATLFRAPLKDFRDVQILATVKAEGGRGVYWHSFGKMWGDNKCCARQVTTLCRDFMSLDPAFTYCDGAGRMKATAEGLADPYYAGFGKHLSWYAEPSIGRIYFAGPQHWAVAYARVGEMITQNPHCHNVYPDKDELPGWFFHPAGRYDILISDVVMFKGVDSAPPERVANVRCTVASGKARLSWAKAPDNTLTVWYKVSAGGETVAESAGLSVELPLEKVRGKALTVQAVDFFENVSPPSDPVEAK